MENKITMRFFNVLKDKDGDRSMRSLLEDVSKITPLREREVTLSGDMRVRLERLDADSPDTLAGEVTRIQSANFPSEVFPEGTRALSVENPLGHGIAFRLHHKHNVLGVQYDARVMGPNRILQYLAQKAAPHTLRLQAILRSDDLWARFGRGAPKEFSIAISNPDSLDRLADPGEPVASAMKRMGDAYAAPKIYIRIAMGRRRGALRENITSEIKQFFQAMTSGTIHVDKMTAKVSREDAEGVDHINFVNELLSVTSILELPERDPDRSYSIRAQELKTVMQAHGY